MIESGVILYLLLVVIVSLFWKEMRGRTFEDFLEQNAREHHLVQMVITRHPHGGTWKQYQQWIREIEESEDASHA